ncbi:MAG TPA: hypothetical protein VMU31_08035 [Rhizomicrobium sp.]|nr:hypothetical protein [Rhizomicrobium sp.]
MARIMFILAALLLSGVTAEAQSLQKLPLPRSGEENLQFGNAAIAITMPAVDGAPIVITASAPGTKSATLNLENTAGVRQFSPNISMAEMDASNTTPEFFISRYTGGAHCCAEVWILDVVAGQWHIVHGGMWDGAEIIPEDADGDGEYEIVHGDDRFLYKFSCYACAGTPKRVFKLVEGALADVTLSPLYRPMDEKDLPNFQQGCANHDNGACAAFVATASRLGRHDDAWKFMLDHYDRKSDWGLNDCLIYDPNGNCQAPVQYKSYPDALAAFLSGINSAPGSH